ncbi:MAG: SLBB domain-containing protein [Bacteroidaceae bacterium]|nr:SLBB domain-containing protein [Bacteroidaceae bacterium]
MKKILACFALLLPLAVYSQSASMISMARAELQKRGLEETEVRARLLENGIDVDNIPPTEYQNYQGRVTAILNQMQAEKAQANGANPTPSAPAGDDVIAAAASEALTPNDFPQTTQGEAAAEEALEEALKENNVSPTAGDDIYGHSLFTGKSLDVYRTTDGAQAPDTYVMGEGDEVHISIFGSSQTEIHQRIGADGSIQPANSSKIFLKGMTLEQARQAIRNKLATSYSFRPDQIAVTITTARTIMVNIYGEVGVQGGFTLSALNSAFNALAAAGGPSKIGSVRNVQMSRSGKTSRLDLYKYMTEPDANVHYDLQNGDVLFVPVADMIVTIEGAVNRPMRYEMVPGETVKDLIRYAGGLTYNVYPDYLQIERYENGEVKYLEYELDNVLAGSQWIDLKNGDIVRVRNSNKPIEDYVSIEGDVFYGGRYALDKNPTLQTLIDKAQPRYTAMTEYVFVERTRPDETVEVLTIPFPGINGNPDFELQRRDAVRILEQSTYRDVATLSVSGQVREPFSRQFGVNDRMTVEQAIGYAGGLKPSVFPVAYIYRRDLTNPSKQEYLRISLEKDGDTLLQPGDELKIYDNTTFTNVGEVRVSGAVKNPFGTEYDKSLTIHDMIEMAGGFEVGAAYDRVEVFRVNLSKKDEVTLDQITLTVDDNYNIVGNAGFQLQPYDHIVIRRTPNFTMGRTVEVNGRVKYPGTYVLEDNKTQLWEIIQMAGGLLDDADPYARLFRTYNNRGNLGLDLREVKSNKGKIKSDPILMDGDVINIVRLENTVSIRETGTRMGQYIPDEYSSTQKNLIFQGSHNAAWYVRHYAGGFDKLADKNSVTVTFPNNQTESTKRGFLWIRRYPKVESGGVITMRLSEEKREKMEKPKEKIDWGKELSTSISTLTSVISLIILVDRLK